MHGKAGNNIRNMLCNPESIVTSCKAHSISFICHHIVRQMITTICMVCIQVKLPTTTFLMLSKTMLNCIRSIARNRCKRGRCHSHASLHSSSTIINTRDNNLLLPSTIKSTPGTYCLNVLHLCQTSLYISPEYSCTSTKSAIKPFQNDLKGHF